jgi:predicted ester cyclase
MDSTERLIRRFYDELWNRWDLDLCDELLATDLRFRGSLGATMCGREAFRAYAEEIRAAFPDWHNALDDLVVARDRAFARLTWTGTNSGSLGGRPPTGRRVEYVGAGLFRVAGGLIAEAWIVGDTGAFWAEFDRPMPVR